MTSTTVPTSNGTLLRRPLETPSIGPREPAVLEALAALTNARKNAVADAQKVIDENGLTIEVARLRERLIGLPPTDLRRQLLATDGVPEKLFLQAVQESLTAGDDDVTDTTVEDLGKTIAKSFAEMSATLTAALEKIAKAGQTGDGDDGYGDGKPPADRPPGGEPPEKEPGSTRSRRGAS